ncbi:MAG: amidohydrolase family protein [Pirellulales bacterium]|nr:amidohydrolase family protein [Pirellulales bacterium]
MPRRFVLKARCVFPAIGSPIADGAVVVEGDRIASVGLSAAARPEAEEMIDLGNAAILPGLINAHAHLDFSGLDAPLGRRGIGLVDWIRFVFEHRRQASIAREDVISKGIEECICGGVSTIGDIVQPDQTLGNASPCATAGLSSSAENNPLWSTAGQASSGTQNGPEVVRFLELKALTADRTGEAIEQARTHVARGNAGLCPHAPYTVHPELLEAVVGLSAAECFPVAMHLAESPEEMEFLGNGGGPLKPFLEGLGYGGPGGVLADHLPRPMDYLLRLADADRALVVHGNYLDDEEIDFLGESASRMSVVYCPRSHDWFAHAEYPLHKMLSAGATVALGTDGRGSSPDISLLEEMRFVARRHRGVGLDQVLRMGTLCGARALGREDEIGSLSAEKRADLTVVALPDREASDPHELLFHSDLPVIGRWLRGARIG